MRKSGSPSEQQRAAAALSDLARDRPESRSTAVAAGAIPVLLQLLPAEHEEVVKEEAARALAHIVLKSPASQAAAVDAGAVPLLVPLLAEGRSSSLQLVGTRAICNLTAKHTAAAIVLEGAAGPLVRLMSSGGSSSVGSSHCWYGGDGKQLNLQAIAGHALAALAESSTDHHAALLAAGAVPAAAEALASCSLQGCGC